MSAATKAIAAIWVLSTLMLWVFPLLGVDPGFRLYYSQRSADLVQPAVGRRLLLRNERVSGRKSAAPRLGCDGRGSAGLGARRDYLRRLSGAERGSGNTLSVLLGHRLSAHRPADDRRPAAVQAGERPGDADLGPIARGGPAAGVGLPGLPGERGGNRRPEPCDEGHVAWIYAVRSGRPCSHGTHCNVLRGGEVGKAWWWVVGGILLYFIANQLYTYLVLTEQYATGSPIDTGWMLGFGCIAWAALKTRKLLD